MPGRLLGRRAARRLSRLPPPPTSLGRAASGVQRKRSMLQNRRAVGSLADRGVARGVAGFAAGRKAAGTGTMRSAVRHNDAYKWAKRHRGKLIAGGTAAMAYNVAAPGPERSRQNQNSLALRRIRQHQRDALSGLQPFVPHGRNINPKSSGGFTA